MQSLEFWLAVQGEFSESGNDIFLCNGSKTFAEVWEWKDYRKPLIELALTFLDDMDISDFKVGKHVLFIPNPDTRFKYIGMRRVRELFIGYCISRFKN